MYDGFHAHLVVNTLKNQVEQAWEIEACVTFYVHKQNINAISRFRFQINEIGKGHGIFN